MATKIIAGLLLLSFTSLGQQDKFNCNDVLGTPPYFMRHSLSEPNDSLQIDFDILKRCGNLDSIDSELLTGPLFALVMAENGTSENPVTYKTIINSIDSFKKTENYAKFREAIIASKMLGNKIATIAEFEKDKDLLIKAGLPQNELEGFKAFIASRPSQKMTYKEAFAKYSSIEQSSRAIPPDKIQFSKLSDLESAMKTGNETGKKLLIYFSCYACVNARKVEDFILTDDRIKTLLLEKFVYFVAYTDDRTEDKTSNSTLGKKFIKLQADRFKTNYQPYFCVIDKDGNLLSEIGYTNEAEDFLAFLNKALK